MEPLIHVEDLTKSFGQRKILDRFQASFFPGELSVISGESGSGKTTLLNILGLLEPMMPEGSHGGVKRMSSHKSYRRCAFSAIKSVISFRISP